MADSSQAQPEPPVIYGMTDSAGKPSIFTYLNPLPGADARAHYAPDRLLGLGEVRVTREVYWHFLEVLPPAFYEANSFVMMEPTTHTKDGDIIASSYRQAGERYFHRYKCINALAWDRSEAGI